MTVRKLYLFRHGETQWNVAGRMQGRLDSPLTERGEQQALAHGRLLEDLSAPECFWVSTANRTRHTADLINLGVQRPLHYSDDLVERDCGLWSGKTLEQVQSEYPDDWAQREVNAYHHRPGGGENIPDLVARFSRLFEQWQQPSCLAIVTHGVVSRAMLGHFLDLPDDRVASIRHPNELFYELSFDGEHRSVRYYQADPHTNGSAFAHSGEAIEGLCEGAPRQGQASE